MNVRLKCCIDIFAAYPGYIFHALDWFEKKLLWQAQFILLKGNIFKVKSISESKQWKKDNI